MCLSPVSSIGFLAALTSSVKEVGFGSASFPWRVQCPHPTGAVGEGAGGSRRDGGDG